MLATSRYVDEDGGAGEGFRMSTSDVVQKGRRREFWGTVVVAAVLLAAEVPLRQVTTGDLPSVFTFAAVVPGRLSLMLDTALVVAYLFVAYRAYGLVRSFRAPRAVVGTNVAGLVLVCAGAAADLAENLVLWHRLADAGATAELRAGALSVATVALVGAGLAVQAVTLLWYRSARTCTADILAAPPATVEGGTVICCSGGGIRSSAFSLGGLQALARAGIYRDASAVVGVSGGGYVAAAHHVLRWGPDADFPTAGTSAGTARHVDREWTTLAAAPEPFAAASPEMAWVRRHTRYVMDSLRVAAEGALSLAFGIGVNLLLVATAIGTTAWVLAWLLLASGRIQPWPPGDHQALGLARSQPGIGGEFAAGWAPVAMVWLLPAAGAGCFVLVKAWDKLFACPERVQVLAARATTWLLLGGGAATALLLGVPWVLETLTDYAASSGSSWAGLLHQLGLVPTEVCNDVLRTGASACGVDSSSAVAATSVAKLSAASLATVVSAILAVLASAKSAGAGGPDAAGAVRRSMHAVWAKVKDPVVPWTAAIVIVVVLVLVLLRWVAAFVDRTELFLHWRCAYLVAVLLVLAKLFTEPNRTSLHHFFRERISTAFLLRRNDWGGVEPVPYRRPLRFSEAVPRDGGPALVSCAVANVSDAELVPSRRGCTPFVFDHSRIGLTDRLLPLGAAQRASATYEFGADPFYRDATVPAAVAISAAAFSPMAGRENVRLGPYRAVLALGNARLGVWLPNPIWLDDGRIAHRLLRLGRWAAAADVVDAMPEAERPRWTARAQRRLDHGRRQRRLLDADAALVTAIRTGDAEQRCAALAQAARVTAPRAPYAELAGARQAVRDSLAGLSAPGRSVWFWTLVEVGRNMVKKPGLTRLVKEGVGKASVYDRFLYVTDGGHYDNLGLIEALRRRPERVVVLDASNDPEDTFRTLGRAIATARMDLDLEVEMDPRGMRRLAESRSPAAWCAGTYRHTSEPGKPLGRIYLVKAIMLDGLPWDVEAYSGANAQFPRTSTGKQLYSEFDFEAYRALGEQTTAAMLDATRGATVLGTPPPIDGFLDARTAADGTASNGHRAAEPANR